MERNVDGIFEKVGFDKDSSILFHWNQKCEDYPMHWHTAMEIIMPLENSYAVGMNKMAYSLSVGDILIIPPGELHALYAPSFGSRIVLLFDPSLLHGVNGFSSILPVLLQPRIITSSTAPELHKRLQALLLSMKDEYVQKLPLFDAYVSSLLIQFFIYIGRNHLDADTLFPMVRQGKQREYIEKFHTIFDYIDKNYAEDLSLDTVSGVAGFSKFHFSRLFKQFTDMSFYDYLNQRRVRAAEELLLDPDIPITEIAMRSGFSSISTFNRVFKSFKQCTPSEFKRLYDTDRYMASIAEEQKNKDDE